MSFNLKIFKRKLGVLLGIPVLTVVASYFLIAEIGDRYKSTAQIATGFTTDDAVKLNETPATPFDVSTNFTNIIESMNSKPVLSLVSYRLVIHDLEDEKPFRVFDRSKEKNLIIDEKSLNKALGQFKEKLKDMKTLNLYNPQDQMLFAILKGYGYDAQTITKDLQIKRLENSDFIAVDYISENPFLSALTVNVLCQEFIRYNKTLKTDRSSESIEFLKTIADEKKKILDEKTDALNKFRLNNNVFNHDAETKNKIALITDYELNRDREASTINRLEFSLRKIETTMEVKSKSLGKANQQETILVNQRILELSRQINELMSSGSESSKSRLSQLREELQLETSRLDALSANEKAEAEFRQLEKERDNLKMDLQIAKSNLSSIDQSLRKLKSDVAGSASRQVSTTDLDREVEMATTDYMNAQDKYNAAKNKSLVIGSSIRQILEGQPSYDPETSQATLIMGLSGAGGFLLSFLGILALEIFDVNIRISSRLEKLTGIINLGSVNFLKDKDFNLREVFNDRNSNKEYEMFSHFLRKLRYDVQSSNGKVFLITSTQVKTGKSFLILSLSYALSLVHAKVLIIDTNFRHNSLTKALLPRMDSRKLLKKGIIDEDDDDDDFMLEENNNFSDRFDQQNENEVPVKLNPGEKDIARNLINRTKFPGVDIIGNVGANDSPSEIMAGRDFKEMIRGLSARYDCVLMEGPALNDYSDSKELIDYADKVIPVFAADTSLNHHDRDSVKYFKSVNGKLMGSVLNRVKFKNLAY
jgi:succinoglycan biosynthesis transport protein ExoP